jgi:cytochrome d ubiquinol oxidase subunit I
LPHRVALDFAAVHSAYQASGPAADRRGRLIQLGALLMFDADPLLLSRIQFAFTIAFHILFPSFTIGLAAWLVVLEALWLRTGRPAYRDLVVLWTKVFAISFGMGVVSGVVLSYQFGTNWSRLSDIGGNVLGPLLSYEVLTAFFLEASFLGIMLFGRDRVAPATHFVATALVALGTLISAFWILSANSWMHTPAGYELRDGLVHAVDWFAIIFNPSFPYRFAHMVAAAYLTTAFVVAAVGAWYLLRGRDEVHARIMVGMALALFVWLAPLQVFIGDLHGLAVRDHQPAKLAAMEGHWESGQPADLLLFAWPDQAAETNHYEVGIPNLASLIITHDWNGIFPGLKDFAPADRPYVPIVFWSFRIMVGIGVLMLATALVGAALWLSGRLFASRWFLRWLTVMGPAGFIAVLAGWVTTECGRQPWVVQGLLRTADAHSPVPGASVWTSLALFVLVYGVVFGAGIYYIARLIQRGPTPLEPEPEHEVEPLRRPMAAAD